MYVVDFISCEWLRCDELDRPYLPATMTYISEQHQVHFLPTQGIRNGRRLSKHLVIHENCITSPD